MAAFQYAVDNIEVFSELKKKKKGMKSLEELII